MGNERNNVPNQSKNQRDKTNGDWRNNHTNNQNNIENNPRRQKIHHTNQGIRAPMVIERYKQLDFTGIVGYPNHV